MPRLALAALLVALTAAGCGVAGTPKVDAPVTVYVSLPLTGTRAEAGKDAADGARLALEEADGKAGSIEVRARFLDDAKGRAWDPVTVGANAREAVQDSSAAAYIGELDSEPTRASVPITNNAGLVQVSPGAGAVDLTAPAAGYPDSPDRYQPSGSPSFARVVPSDEVVAQAAANWASELNVRSAEAMSNRSPFENLMASVFSNAAAEHGIETRLPSDPNYGRAIGPGMALYAPVGGGQSSNQGLVLGGSSAQGLTLSPLLDPSRLPGKDFPARFEQRFHRPPGSYAAYGYESMELVLEAIRGAGTDASSFRDNVRNAVFGAQRDDTVLGSYSITEDGDTTECMIQRYRLVGPKPMPLGAPCP